MPRIDDQIALVSKVLAMRLETDESFREEVKKDPVGVLVRNGLPEDLIRGSLSHGGAVPAGDCVDLTCWSSACPGTCSVTAIRTTTCHCPKVGVQDLAVQPFRPL